MILLERIQAKKTHEEKHLEYYASMTPEQYMQEKGLLSYHMALFAVRDYQARLKLLRKRKLLKL